MIITVNLIVLMMVRALTQGYHVLVGGSDGGIQITSVIIAIASNGNVSLIS